MNDEIFPGNYQAWKMCITHKCKIPLTKKFVAERINSLSNKESSEYRNFVMKYGEDWTNTIISYFKKSLEEIL